VLVVNNLSSKPQSVALKLSFGAAQLENLLGGQPLPSPEDGTLPLELKPYQYLWIK
jgi:hypothetical protein